MNVLLSNYKVVRLLMPFYRADYTMRIHDADEGRPVNDEKKKIFRAFYKISRDKKVTS